LKGSRLEGNERGKIVVTSIVIQLSKVTHLVNKSNHRFKYLYFRREPIM